MSSPLNRNLSKEELLRLVEFPRWKWVYGMRVFSPVYGEFRYEPGMPDSFVTRGAYLLPGSVDSTCALMSLINDTLKDLIIRDVIGIVSMPMHTMYYFTGELVTVSLLSASGKIFEDVRPADQFGESLALLLYFLWNMPEEILDILVISSMELTRGSNSIAN